MNPSTQEETDRLLASLATQAAGNPHDVIANTLTMTDTQALALIDTYTALVWRNPRMPQGLRTWYLGLIDGLCSVMHWRQGEARHMDGDLGLPQTWAEVEALDNDGEQPA